MKKFLIHILSVAMSLFLFASLVGCGEEGEGESSVSDSVESTTESISGDEEDKVTAEDMLRDFLSEAVGTDNSFIAEYNRQVFYSEKGEEREFEYSVTVKGYYEDGFNADLVACAKGVTEAPRAIYIDLDDDGFYWFKASGDGEKLIVLTEAGEGVYTDRYEREYSAEKNYYVAGDGTILSEEQLREYDPAEMPTRDSYFALYIRKDTVYKSEYYIVGDGDPVYSGGEEFYEVYTIPDYDLIVSLISGYISGSMGVELNEKTAKIFVNMLLNKIKEGGGLGLLDTEITVDEGGDYVLFDIKEDIAEEFKSSLTDFYNEGENAYEDAYGAIASMLTSEGLTVEQAADMLFDAIAKAAGMQSGEELSLKSLCDVLESNIQYRTVILTAYACEAITAEECKRLKEYDGYYEALKAEIFKGEDDEKILLKDFIEKYTGFTAETLFEDIDTTSFWGLLYTAVAKYSGSDAESGEEVLNSLAEVDIEKLYISSSLISRGSRVEYRSESVAKLTYPEEAGENVDSAAEGGEVNILSEESFVFCSTEGMVELAEISVNAQG